MNKGISGRLPHATSGWPAIACAAMVVLFAGCATPQDTFTLAQLESMGASRLDGRDLREAFANRTHYGTHLDDGSTWLEYYAPDGSLAFIPGGRPQYGRWWVSGEEVCFEYVTDSEPGPYCFFFYRLDQSLYGVENVNRADAEVYFIIDDIRVGDVEGLAG